jgi:serine/threonine protein kinase
VEFYTYDEMDLDTYNRLTGENIKPSETEKITMFPYLVYEWLEGETLAEKLAEAQGIGLKSFPLSWAAGKMMMLACALKAMQEAEIIHRDIKLANLFLTKAQILKLFDFGIARGVAGTGTQAGSVMGTNIYMAPEQMGGLALLVLQETFRIPKDEVAVSTKSDLYSTGVTFWEMITGEPPFEPIKQFGDRAELQSFMKSPPPEIIGKLKEMDQELVMDLALLYKKIPSESKNEHASDIFKGLRSKQGDLLLLLRKIFSRTLAKDPRRRYSDPEEFRIDLLNFIVDYQKYQENLALLMRLIPAAHEDGAVRP